MTSRVALEAESAAPTVSAQTHIRTEAEKTKRRLNRQRRRRREREEARQVTAALSQLVQSQEQFWIDADGRKYCCAKHAPSLRAELVEDRENIIAYTGCTFLQDTLKRLDPLSWA